MKIQNHLNWDIKQHRQGDRSDVYVAGGKEGINDIHRHEHRHGVYVETSWHNVGNTTLIEQELDNGDKRTIRKERFVATEQDGFLVQPQDTSIGSTKMLWLGNRATR